MRLEKNKDGTYNVWMNRTEYREIPRNARSWKEEIAIRLMGDCGLRVEETRHVTKGDVQRYPNGKHHKLRVTGAKDTTGEYDDGQERETWLPRDLETLIHRYATDEGLNDHESLIPNAKRTVQLWVEHAASAAADAAGDDDYEHVSSHDLRRCWAHHLLVEEGVGVRVVMALGGWSNYSSIEPYLNAPSEENIIREMREVEL
ncbi:tyrosine-type recombinase/integrase [Natronococcus roseus]|uniref:tyrosine-type recombinase/integrase n=1 Tax=Natronococcus roseus TaxID=1052014 RepID=UPI00374D1B83